MFDIGESNDGPFIAMEFIYGEDLKSLLARIGRLPIDKGLQIAFQLCAGLAAAQGRLLFITAPRRKAAGLAFIGAKLRALTDF